MDKFIRKINLTLINSVLLLISLVVLTYFFISNNLFGPAFITIFIIALVFLFDIILFFYKRRITVNTIKNLKFYCEGTNAKDMPNGTIQKFQLPIAFMDYAGSYIWGNNEFIKLFNDAKEIKKTIEDIYKTHIQERYSINIVSPRSFDINNKTYMMFTDVICPNNDEPNFASIMVYFIDVTEHENLKIKFDNRRVSFAEIAIDNYEDIYLTNGEAVVNEVSVEFVKLLKKWLESTNSVVKKLVRDRYIVIFDDVDFKKFEADGFSIIDDVKNINVGNKIPVTLSVGIGAYGEFPVDNYKMASEALDLALNRGGDQVVERTPEDIKYFGGTSIETESLNKVRARVVGELLKQEILNSSNVIIMGHSRPDMDSLGATLCVYRACEILEKNACIVLNDNIDNIKNILEKLNESKTYEKVFITDRQANSMINANTLLVVVDTSRPSQTESPNLLDLCKRVAVIDHHRKASDFIKNAVVDYCESYASSTGELLVEILQQTFPSFTMPLVEAEAVYAGMMVDTKNFTSKTGSRTFEVAAFLKNQGVNTGTVRQFFAPDMTTFQAVSATVAKADFLFGKIAIAVVEPETRNAQLVSSMAADQLLTISNVSASFAIYVSNDIVSISGRSLGEINVQLILEKFGGGGHLTAAGAKMPGYDIEGAKVALTEAINEYIER